MGERAVAREASASVQSGAIATFFPGYFALVMATGIVSLAAHFLELEPVASALFWINVVAYVVLWLLTIARLALYPRALLADLGDHVRGPGFFTFSAGTCVLGTQFAVLRHEASVASALWVFGIVLWALATYAFFAAVIIKANKPSLGECIGGTWLLAVVATQSIAVLGSVIAPTFASPDSPLLVAAAMHLAGFMLYLPLISFLLYRLMFLELRPQQLAPPYWINMGALAISALAGARLLQSTGSPLVARLAPFLAGATFFFWAAATWWIPLLLILGFWRHAIRRVPFVYDPQYWSMVFPLGMYTVCTVQMSRALDLPIVMGVARVFLWPALAAWCLVFFGLLASLARSVARSAH